MAPLKRLKKKKKNLNRFKVDLHVHTKFSEDSTKLPFINISFNPLGNPEELYQTCFKKGLNAVTFTDHDTIDGCKYFLDKNPETFNKTFFLGVELLTQVKDFPKLNLEFNIFRFTEEQFKEFFKLKSDAFELIEYLNKNNIPFQFNHPYWYLYYYKKYNNIIKSVAKRVPVIEIINGHRSKMSNRLAKRLAYKFNKGKSGGSDTHAYNTGMAYTAAKANNLDEFFTKFKDGKTYADGKSRIDRKFVEESASIYNKKWQSIVANSKSSTFKSIFYTILKFPTKLLFKGIIKSYTRLGN